MCFEIIIFGCFNIPFGIQSIPQSLSFSFMFLSSATRSYCTGYPTVMVITVVHVCKYFFWIVVDCLLLSKTLDLPTAATNLQYSLIKFIYICHRAMGITK
jgi:hypothetical protein